MTRNVFESISISEYNYRKYLGIQLKKILPCLPVKKKNEK